MKRTYIECEMMNPCLVVVSVINGSNGEIVLIVFTVLPVLLFNKNRVVEFDSNKHHLL